MVTRWCGHLVRTRCPPPPRPTASPPLLITPLLSYASSFRASCWKLARAEFSRSGTDERPRVALFTQREHSILLSPRSPFSTRSVGPRPLHHPFPRLASPPRRAAISRTRLPVCVRTLARHNYYLLDTHHRFIPRVFHGRNRYRLMTESASRPFAPSRSSHRGKLSSLLGRAPPDSLDETAGPSLIYPRHDRAAHLYSFPPSPLPPSPPALMPLIR